MFGLKETNNWKVNEKRYKIKTDADWRSKIMEFYFHPFDVRWIFYHDQVIDRDRWRVMQHMLIPNNMGLNLMREYAYKVTSYNYALISDAITNDRIFVSNRGAAYFFPLYVFTNQRKKRVTLTKADIDNKSIKSNISSKIVAALEKSYGRMVMPEEILYYIYAVLYSEHYRHQYSEFLKTDFPRIPLTNNEPLFTRMGQLGKLLCELHLLKSEKQFQRLAARFEGKGESMVVSPYYDKANLRVFINRDQYFEGVTFDIWSYQIGRYQIVIQWLKDRKGRILSLGDIKQYCKIITAINSTLEIQEKIDELYSETEHDIIKIEHVSLVSDLNDYS